MAKKQLIRLQAPKGATQVTHDDETYDVETKGKFVGTVEVPDRAVELLGSHGFTPYTGPAEVQAVQQDTQATQPATPAPTLPWTQGK